MRGSILISVCENSNWSSNFLSFSSLNPCTIISTLQNQNLFKQRCLQISNMNHYLLITAEMVSFFFFSFLGQHMKIPRSGVKLELQLLAYTSHSNTGFEPCFCDLCRRLWELWILNPLSKARDWTHILMDISWIFNPLSHNRNSLKWYFSYMLILRPV